MAIFVGRSWQGGRSSANPVGNRTHNLQSAYKRRKEKDVIALCCVAAIHDRKELAGSGRDRPTHSHAHTYIHTYIHTYTIMSYLEP